MAVTVVQDSLDHILAFRSKSSNKECM